jgi:hypothetical protein
MTHSLGWGDWGIGIFYDVFILDWLDWLDWDCRYIDMVIRQIQIGELSPTYVTKSKDTETGSQSGMSLFVKREKRENTDSKSCCPEGGGEKSDLCGLT